MNQFSNSEFSSLRSELRYDWLGSVETAEMLKAFVRTRFTISREFARGLSVNVRFEDLMLSPYRRQLEHFALRM
jgi:hypothetical protein